MLKQKQCYELNFSDKLQQFKFKKIENLSLISIDISYLIKKFGKPHNIKEEEIMHLADDQPQETDTDTCGILQLYFSKNLF